MINTGPQTDLQRNTDNLGIAAGLYGDRRVIHKFGRNAAVGSSVEDIWLVGGIYDWFTVASQLEIVSTAAGDAAAGAGARLVRIEGLDANFVEIFEDVIPTGVTPVATSQSFLRVNRAFVVESGTYGKTGVGHAGTITVRGITAGPDQAQIGIVNGVPLGQSQLGRYTVPAGHTAYVNDLHAFVTGVGTNTASIILFRRPNADIIAAPFAAARLLTQFEGVDGPAELDFETPHRIPEKTDIWVAAFTSMGTAIVSVDFEIILLTNPV